MQQRLPDFIVIGAQKAGTSTIHGALSLHPGVAMALRTEVEYFGDPRKTEQGPEYYRTFFPDVEEGMMVGEVSPGYMVKEGVPEKMATLLPEARLVASLREPADRAFSAWKMQVSKGSDLRPFAEAVRREPHYLEFGRYGEQLQRVLRYFNREQVLVLEFEGLRRDPEGYFRTITDFLGLPALSEPVGMVNPGGMPRHMGVTRVLNAAFRARNALRETPLRPLVDNLLVDRLSRQARNRIAEANRDPELEAPGLVPEDAEWIRMRLAEDVALLRDLLGEDAPAWAEGYGA